MSNSNVVQLEPKHSTTDDNHPLILPSSSTQSSLTSTDSTSPNDGKGSSTLAALSRTLIATLAFLFKRPIRLFRPVKISTWAGIQAIAQEHGLKTVNRQFVRSLIKREGWKFIPRHILPPMVVNAMIGLTLFTSYTAAERLLLSTFAVGSSSIDPLLEFLYIPFISGSVAGAAQSILSTPLDNARLLLLRRQRYLRKQSQAGEGGVGSSGKKTDERRRKKRKGNQGIGGMGGRPGGLPFVNWYQLLRDSLFQSSSTHSSSSPSTLSTSTLTSTNSKKTLRDKRIEQARQWARKGWSLFGLTLVKDSVGFGIFFATFELGREASRRIGLSIDGISVTGSQSRNVEGREKDEEEEEEKKKRSFLGIAVQSFGILLSGGLAGYVFVGLGRPFERMRGAVWEGRARWAESDAKIAVLQETIKRKELEGEYGAIKAKERRRGQSMGGKSERRTRKLLGAKKRKIGMVRIGQLRGLSRKGSNILSEKRLSRRRRMQTKGGIVSQAIRRAADSLPLARPGPLRSLPAHPPRPPSSPLSRTPPPSAPSLIISALSRYGPATFLFAPRSVLQSLDERLPRLSSVSAAQTSFPALTSSFRSSFPNSNALADGELGKDKAKGKPVTKVRNPELDGPTRFIAKRRHLQEIEKLRQSGGGGAGAGGATGRGWKIVSKVFTFVPPYAVGFLVYALVEGDLKAEV